MSQIIGTAIQVQTAIGSIGSNPYKLDIGEDGKEIEDVKGEDTDDLITGFAAPMLALIALGGIVSGACAMVFTVSSIVDIASVCLFGLAPLVVYQKRKLHKLGGMRGQINEMRRSVNTFSCENDKLTKNIDGLQAQANDLKTVQGELDDIANTAGGQVDRLVQIIKEQDEIQARIKKNLEHQVMQDLLDSVLASDTDQDFTFDKRELKRLKLRLSNIPGVHLHKDNFDKLLLDDQKEITVSEIMEMFRNLMDDTIPNEDNIFELKPEQIIKEQQGGNSIFSSFKL